MTLRHPDLIGAALIAAMAVAIIVAGATTPDPGFGVVPPAAFPVTIGVLMLAAAALLLVETLRARRAVLTEAIDARPLASTAIATAAFLFAFVPLGFLVSAALFVPVQARILGSRAPVRDIVVGVVFAVAVYLLFVRFLTIDLPSGPLPKELPF